MKKIGILFGKENTFPPAVVERINSMKVPGVTAEFVKIGGIEMAAANAMRPARDGGEIAEAPKLRLVQRPDDM